MLYFNAVIQVFPAYGITIWFQRPIGTLFQCSFGQPV